MATIKSDIVSQMRFMGPEPEPFMLTGWCDLAGVLNWYNYYYRPSDTLPFLLTYLRDNNYPKDQIDALRSVPDWTIQFNLMTRARMLTRGFILPGDEQEKFDKKLRETIATAVGRIAKEKREKVIKFPTFTQRDKEMEQIGEVESAIDDFLITGNTEFSAYNWFRKVGTNQNVVRRYSEKLRLIMREVNDLEVQSEVMNTMPLKGRKAYTKFLEKLIADCNSYTNAKAATKTVNKKPRKIKEKSADQLAKGVKYLKESAEHKLVSVSPASIIGAQEVYLFNSKNRNLHRYVADSDKGLSVQGSKIIGINEAEQSMKKVRKPELMLPELLKANKHGAKRIITGIKGTEHKGNHRIDANMIILKVYR